MSADLAHVAGKTEAAELRLEMTGVVMECRSKRGSPSMLLMLVVHKQRYTENERERET